MDKTEEKNSTSLTGSAPVDVDDAESQSLRRRDLWLHRFKRWGVETRGITPVPDEERVDTRFINVFFVWFTMSTNLLP